MADPRDTPAMQQYYRFKKRHPDCVLMFRIGDFYELFDDDAVTVSKAIGLTLTQRTAGVPESWRNELVSQTVFPSGRRRARNLVLFTLINTLAPATPANWP